MNLKSIYKEIGIEPDLKKEIPNFNRRMFLAIEQFAQHLLHVNNYTLQMVEQKVAIAMSADEVYVLTYYINKNGKDRKTAAENIFAVRIMQECLGELYREDESPVWLKALVFLDSKMNDIFEMCVVKVGYEYQNHQFIKTDIDELTVPIIGESLEWLNSYPNSKTDFKNALDDYYRKRYPVAISNAYSALESLVKDFLNTDQGLDNEEVINNILRSLKLQSNWSGILNHYCKAAHNFSARHGKRSTKVKEVKKPDPELAEFFIYITGVFIRLIIRTIQKNK